MNSSSPESSLQPNYRRRGARQSPSCRQCQQRKIKCDRKLPCDRCVRGRRAGACSYVSITQTTLSATSSRASRDIRYSETDELGSSGQTSEAASVDVNALIRKVQELEERVQRLSDAQATEPSAKLSTNTCIFRKGRGFGRSHWMHFVDEFPSIALLDKLRQEDTEIRTVLEKCKRLQRERKAQRATHEPRVPRPCVWELVPSKDICDKLVDAYLRTIESVFRIIHVPSFMGNYKCYWEDPQSANEVCAVKLLLILVIGNCFSPAEGIPSLRSSVTGWIYACQAWFDSLARQSRMTIHSIQIQCLLLLARQVSNVGAEMLWISTGSLLHTAMQMGLHWSPRHMRGMNVFEAEMRRRLWATISELVVQASVDTGMAPTLSKEDFDCEPPSNIDDDDLQEDAQLPPTPKPPSCFTQSTAQILLFRSLPIRLEIAKHLNHPGSDNSYGTTLRLHAELIHALPPEPHLPASPAHPIFQPTGLSPFQTKLLTLLTRRFLLALHNPYALGALENSTYRISRTASFSTSLLLLSFTKTTTVAPRSPVGNAASSHLLWLPDMHDHPDDFAVLARHAGGMFREPLLHSAIAISTFLVAQHRRKGQEGVSSDHPNLESQFCGTLQSDEPWEDQARNAIELFVQQGAERVRARREVFMSILVFSLILEMVKTSGNHEDITVKTAIRDILQLCLEILSERAVEAEGGNGEDCIGQTADISAVIRRDEQNEHAHMRHNGSFVPSNREDEMCQWDGMISDFHFDFDFASATETLNFDGLI